MAKPDTPAASLYDGFLHRVATLQFEVPGHGCGLLAVPLPYGFLSVLRAKSA
jgi:hypothetical protein